MGKTYKDRSPDNDRDRSYLAAQKHLTRNFHPFE